VGGGVQQEEADHAQPGEQRLRGDVSGVGEAGDGQSEQEDNCADEV
jgi:hypothetical protein